MPVSVSHWMVVYLLTAIIRYTYSIMSNINNDDPLRFYHIKNTKVVDNLPTESAVRCDGENAKIENTLIANNTGHGLGVVNAGIGLDVTNCTIANNGNKGIHILYNNMNASIVNVKNTVLWNDGETEFGVNNDTPPTIFNVENSIY